MYRNTMGLWLGAAALAVAACAHTDSTRSTQTMTTNPVNSPAGTPSPTAKEPYAGTSGGPGTEGMNRGVTPPGTTGESGSTGTMEPSGSEKAAILATADSSQPGVVQEYSEGTLTLTSPSQGGRQMPRVQTLSVDRNVPIFSGDARVSTDALVPGADVRVYYKEGQGDEQRQVIGVDILRATSSPDSGQGSGQPPMNNGMDE